MRKRQASREDKQIIGARMKRAADEKQLSSGEVANLLLNHGIDVASASVRQWWTGKNMPSSAEKWVAYAAIVDCSLEWLMTGTEEGSPLPKLFFSVEEVSPRTAPAPGWERLTADERFAVSEVVRLFAARR